MYTQLQLRDSARPPVTLTTLNKMREEGEPIAALTCYDASFAVLLDEANVRRGAGGRFAGHGDSGARHHCSRDR